ncbi:MAG: histidine phosphatase family protein [Flavobacteriaceae bacterium]
MKKVVIVRHAKSSWEGHLKDFDRPLNSRGLEDIERMPEHFKELGIIPDIIVSSPANRAQTTAKGFVKALNFPKTKFFLEGNLYDFYGDELLKVIKKTPDTVTTLMLFGHNYAVTNFVNSYGSLSIDNVPTCGLVILDFDIDTWSDLSKGKTVLTLFPKNM